VLIGTDAVRNIVRDDKSFQLSTVMQSGAAVGMHTLNADLVEMVHRDLISEEHAKEFSNDRRELVERLGLR
jgi:twitching motility protein PilT